MLKPIILEVCDHGAWSLELKFGEGDNARDLMRLTSDFLRQLFDNADLKMMKMVGYACEARLKQQEVAQAMRDGKVSPLLTPINSNPRQR